MPTDDELNHFENGENPEMTKRRQTVGQGLQGCTHSHHQPLVPLSKAAPWTTILLLSPVQEEFKRKKKVTK